MDVSLDDVAAIFATRDFSTPWSRQIKTLLAKMTAEERAEFPDLIRIDEAHTLMFTANRVLAQPGLSLLESISACGRRLRGMRLSLATDAHVLISPPTSLHRALQQAYGREDSWPSWDPKQPLEVHLGVMLIVEWQGVHLPGANAHEATQFAAQLECVLTKWRDAVYRKKVMDRLQELGVEDFNADDLHSRLLQLLSEFYINHPTGVPRKERGLSLIEEIVVFDKEAFTSIERLARIKISQGNLREAYNIAHKAMEVAVASKFQYNAARLGLCAAEAIVAGARGPGYSMAQVKPLLEASRRRLDACKFWLPPNNYAVYDERLRGYERRFKIKVGSKPGEPSLHAIPTEPREPNNIIGQTLRHCAGCKEPSLETKKCSGCREVYYCSMKCQREDWASHKKVCKRKQAEREKASGE